MGELPAVAQRRPVRRTRALIAFTLLALLASCAADAPAAVVSTSSSTSSPASSAPSTIASSASTTTSTTPPVPVYAFPFVGRNVSYGSTHHDYPAIDVFGCGATVVAPTNGTVVQVRDFDPWDPHVNAGSTRGGMYVSMVGVDGVRYYFAHLAAVQVRVGQAVQPGDVLGPMGQTGDARNSVCHTHVGLSWTCPSDEWKVRRGKVWPMQYLDAWRTGEQRSPVAEVEAEHAAEPGACDDAIAQPDAAYG